MANVTYKPSEEDWDHKTPSVPQLEVYRDGAYAGTIFRRHSAPFAYFYQPNDTCKISKDYATLDELKASLEGKE
jgi:hypothetical protein